MDSINIFDLIEIKFCNIRSVEGYKFCREEGKQKINDRNKKEFFIFAAIKEDI